MIKRHAISVNRKALDLLEGADVLSPRSIHKLRVATKRLRSFWKFAEPETGKTKSRTAQRSLRDLARTLAKDRDLKVMRDTLGRLEKHTRSGKAREIISKVEGAISRASPGDKQENSERIKLLRNAFMKDLENWESLGPHSNGISFDQRITKTYRGAHGLAGDARKTGDIKIFHKSRRWTKYLRYQIEMLEPDRSPWLKAHFKRLKKLGRELGRRHDLYVLRNYVEKSNFLETGDKRQLIDLIEAEDAKTLSQCRRFSESLFALAPNDYQHRVNVELTQNGLLEPQSR